MSEFGGVYGDTKTRSLHRRLGSATLSQMAFPRESNPSFSWEKSEWDNTVVTTTTKSRASGVSYISRGCLALEILSRGEGSWRVGENGAKLDTFALSV